MGIMNDKELQQGSLCRVPPWANIDTNRIAGVNKNKKTYPSTSKHRNVMDQGDKRKQSGTGIN
jgi:hypothetical protein